MLSPRQTIYREDVDYLDEILLDESGFMKPVPAALLVTFLLVHLQIWANDHAVFQFATTELIDWLRQEIGVHNALEINAGNGVIGRSLGIVGIDSRIQGTKKFQEKAAEVYQQDAADFAFTMPPKDIKKYEALEAVRVFRPHTVVGAFVTQKAHATDAAHKIPSNIWGVNEEELITRVKKYIHFGNLTVHEKKRIYKYPHKVLEFPWLVTRCIDQSGNRVWIWEQ